MARRRVVVHVVKGNPAGVLAEWRRLAKEAS